MKFDQLKDIVSRELEAIRVPDAQAKCRLLISISKPMTMTCPHYLTEKEVIPVVPSESGIFVCYLDKAAYPWGVVDTTSQFLPYDDHWFITLEDAFYHSPGWEGGVLPDDYEID